MARYVKELSKEAKELDRIAKMLVRRDFELLQTNETVRLLDEAKAKDEALLASIGDGIVATDKEGNAMTVNHSAEAMLGWSAQELISKNWYSVMTLQNEDGMTLPKEQWPITRAFESHKKIVVTTCYYLRKDKTRFPVAITASPVILDRKMVGAIVVFRDITKEKQIDRAKSEFVSLASHQLRTPVTAIKWYVDMLLSGELGALAPKQNAYLKKVYESNERMAALVNALLNTSRIELGILAVKPQPVKLQSLAESVIEELKPQIEEKKLQVEKTYGKELPPINADPQLVRIIFQNLLSNAVQYTPERGRIHLSIVKEQSDVLITVADTGYGIPQGQQSKIFTKLFRADNVLDKDTDGTGLGLYIVKSVLEQTGGKIWFKSPSLARRSFSEGGSAVAEPARQAGGAVADEQKNPGTTFYVTIPLSGMQKKEGNRALSVMMKPRQRSSA